MTKLQWKYIQKDEDLGELLQALATVENVPLDLEADSMHCYHAKICLIQITVQKKNFIVDPLADLNLEILLHSLKDKNLIIHGSDYDLRMMRDSWDFYPRSVWDTMLAARYMGEAQFGLAAIVEKEFNVQLDKTNQKAQWSQRPLSEDLLAYAALDTYHLEELYERQRDKLLRLNRHEWLVEHCQSLQEQIRTETTEVNPDRWRIKGSSTLNTRQLGFVQKIWGWRENRAAERDLPPFKILTNEKIIELAKIYATAKEIRIEKLPKLPRNFNQATQKELVDVLKEALEIPPHLLPERKKRLPPQTPSPHPVLMERIKNFRENKASQLQIDSHLLANKNQLVFLALNKPKSFGECESSGLMSWQWKIFENLMNP